MDPLLKLLEENAESKSAQLAHMLNISESEGMKDSCRRTEFLLDASCSTVI